MKYESNKNYILLSPIDQGEAKVTCDKEFFLTHNQSYFSNSTNHVQLLLGQIENCKSSKKSDYFAIGTKIVSNSGKQLRYKLKKQYS